MEDLVLHAARVLSGLLAGIYVAFLVAVLPALRTVNDAVFVTVMNRINEAIVNPVFIAVFLGAPLATAALLGWQRGAAVVAATLLGLGALAITFVGNLPLNDALARGGPRDTYQAPWLIWHTVRTAAAVASFVVLCQPSLGGAGRS